MKTPLWFPQSFFSRTLWLVLIVVLFSKALTLVYLLMNEDVLVDRQYSHGVALTLRAYWAADPENREKIAKAATLVRVAGAGVPEDEHPRRVDHGARQRDLLRHAGRVVGHQPVQGVFEPERGSEVGGTRTHRVIVDPPQYTGIVEQLSAGKAVEQSQLVWQHADDLLRRDGV